MPGASHIFFGRGKIGGIRQDLNAYEVPPGQFVDLNAMRVRKGCPDGTDMGTGEYLNGSTMAFKLYAFTPWNSANGQNYIFAYASTGKITYTTDNWETWDFLETTDGNDLTLGASHVIPHFLVRGNKSLLISNGIDSVYLVDGVAFPGSGALKATELKTCPSFVEGWFLHGTTIVHDGEVVYSSSPLDMDRFYSTIQERTDRIYDDNCWVAPAAPGVSGHITKGIYMGEDSIMLFTTTGVYWLGLEPDGEGIMRLNIINLLDGAGAHSGAACPDGRGNGYFFTDYNRGDILRLSRGGQRGGGKVDIEARNGWAVRSVGYGLRETLKSMPASNRKYLQMVVDEKGDWERVGSSLRSNINTTKLPGKIFIDPSAHITPGGAWAEIDTGNFSIVNIAGQPIVAVEEVASHGAEYVYDSNPNYDNSETNYSGAGTYAEFKVGGAIGGLPDKQYWGIDIDPTQIGFIKIRKNGAWTNVKVSGTDATFKFSNPGANSWQDIAFDEIHPNVDAIMLQFAGAMKVKGQIGTNFNDFWVVIYIGVIASITPQNVAGVRIFDTHVSGSGQHITTGNLWQYQNLRVGEIWPIGSVGTQATYYSDPAPDGASVKSNLVIKGFTPSSAAEFGRITTRFTKVDNVYYPKLYIRIGKTQYPPKDDNSTTNPTSTGGAGVATANWSAWRLLTLTELEQGLKLTDSGFNYSGGAATPSAAQADGTGWLWVRFKVQLDLDTKSRLSSIFDRLRIYGIAGTLPLANHFMFAGPDDHIFLCAPSTSGSAENDIAVFYDPMRDAMLKTEGQWITAACKKGGSYYVATGRCVAKLWEGDHNYVYDSVAGTTSDVALQRRLETGAIRGRALKALRHRFYVEKLEAGGTIEANISSTKYDATKAYIIDTQYVYSTGLMRQKQLVYGKDGYLYYLWVGPSGTPSLYLSKLSPTTGEKLQTWTIESRATNYQHYGFSMIADLEGDNLLIAYGAYKTADASSPYRRLSFAKFNIDSQDFTSNGDIYSAVSNVYYYYPALELDANGDIYYFYAYSASATYYIKAIRSIDGGENWTSVISLTPPSNNKYQLYPSKTHDNKLCLLYKKEGSGSGYVLYFREMASGLPGDEIIISPPTGNAEKSSMAATPSGTYVLMFNSATTLLIYKYNSGNFTLVKSVSASSTCTPLAVPLPGGNMFIGVKASGGSNFSCYIGQDEDWSSEATLLTSSAVINAFLLDACTDENGDIFLVGGYTDGTNAYRIFKAEVSEITGGYPLQTYVKTENEAILTYSDRETFATPRIIPENENPGKTGTCRQLSQVLEAYGPCVVALGEIDFLEQS